MEAGGFRALLARGAEWAATGHVTLPAPSAASALDYDGLVDAAATYEPSGTRARLIELDQAVAETAASPQARELLARTLAKRLAEDRATPDASRHFCQALSLIGGASEVPVLAGLLKDTNFCYDARLALERIPDETAANALRDALNDRATPDRAGIIESLAARRDSLAVPDLLTLARAPEDPLSTAALRVLGRFGKPEVWAELSSMENVVSATQKTALREAQLECATLLVAAGQGDSLVRSLETLLESNETPLVRGSAFNLWLQVAGEQALPRARAALTGSDQALQSAAIKWLRAGPVSRLENAAELLAGLQASVQEPMLAVLVERRVSAASSRVAALLDLPDSEVRLAAIRALAWLGDAAAVDVLLSRLPNMGEGERLAAEAALARIPAPEAEPMLLRALETGDPPVQIAALRALKAREAAAAVPILLRLGHNGSESLRLEAIRALGQLAGSDACDPMLAWVDEAPPAVRAEVEAALAAISRRRGTVPQLAARLGSASAAQQVVLVNALASAGGPDAVRAISTCLDSDRAEVRLAAVRQLAEWPDATPLKILGEIARAPREEREGVLARRAVVRLAGMAEAAQFTIAAQAISGALENAPAGEKKALIEALGLLPDPASLEIAGRFLNDPALGAEAREASFRILEALDPKDKDQALRMIAILQQSTTEVPEKARLDWLAMRFRGLQNLARGAKASNPDGLAADGEGGPPAAAIDGNEKTYWDEVDGQPLYILRVELKESATVGALKVVGWKHESYAPRDFEILGDGRVLSRVENARYADNVLRVTLPPTACRTIELRITRAYGASPAIRELEILGKPGA
jgi:HEAT repeat protein